MHVILTFNDFWFLEGLARLGLIGINRKRICNFLLVFHCNYMSVFYRFGNQKTRVPGLPDCQNSMILRLLVLMHYQHVTDR